MLSNVEFERVATEGVIGVLARHDEQSTRVLVLGGSEGRIPEQLSAAVAGEGFTTLGLAYYGQSNLPKNLEEIPLDYVERALEWFCNQTNPEHPKVAVVGASKGAELALLVAASFPTAISAVAAFAPSSVVFAGINRFTGTSSRSSWSRFGQPLPFVPYPKGARPGLSLRGLRTAPIYESALANEDAVRAAAIPVESIDAPILLVSGDQDQMWPATRMAEMITTRLRDHGKADLVTHLRYPDAGHALRPAQGKPSRNIRTRFFDLGGTADANATAADDFWPQFVEFVEAAAP